jgi:hypothetical protein
LVGLPAITVLGVVDDQDAPIVVYVETLAARPSSESCAGAVVIKVRPNVWLVDLPCFGRATRLVWRKRRWSCPNETCTTGEHRCFPRRNERRQGVVCPIVIREGGHRCRWP